MLKSSNSNRPALYNNASYCSYVYFATTVGSSLIRRSVAPNGSNVTSTTGVLTDTGLCGGCPVQMHV